MQVRFTKHARERMEERNVSEETVLDILENYDNLFPGTGRSEKAIRYEKDRVVTVSFVEIKRRRPYLLITTVMVD